MEVKLAEHLGFCFGVKRALKITEDVLRQKRGNFYSLGPLIHNPQVVEHLKRKGLKIVRGVGNLKKGTLIIRSHGISPAVVEEAKQKRLTLIDATCPYVASAQRKVRLLKRDGYRVIIFGEKNHPEVKALMGVASGDVTVVENKSEIAQLNLKEEKIGVVAQTTQLKSGYSGVIAQSVKKDFRELRIFNTICSATAERQNAARKLAREVELMLVVGGRASANTKRLAQICRETGTETHHLEKPRQIKALWLKGKSRIGVTGGASTPRWLIEEVVEKIRVLTKSVK